MRCQQCGKDIADKRVCPYCGKEQQEFDPFHCLGDLFDEAEPAVFYSKAGEHTSAFGEPICGDMPATGGFKDMDVLTWDAEESAPVCGDAPAVGGFMDMDALTWDAEESAPVCGDAPAVGGFMDMDALTCDEEGEAVYGDSPAIGGFKAMDSFTSEDEEPESTTGDEPGKGGFRGLGSLIPGNEDSNRVFVWKRWMTIAACCAVLILSATFVFKNQDNPSNPKLDTAIDTYIQNELCTGESLPLMLQYQNALLGAITYEVQSCNVDRGTMDVKFTYVDALQLADSFSGSNISADNYYSTCIKAIQSRNCKMITEVISVTFKSYANGYALMDSDLLTNVLSGGILDYYLGLLEDGY